MRANLRGKISVVVLMAISLMATALLISGCGKSDSDVSQSNQPTGPQAQTAVSPNTVQLTFTYESAKKEWITDVTSAFNAAHLQTAAGKTILVTAVPMGSGDCIDELLNDRRQTDITSPASSAFIDRGNSDWKIKTGKDLIGPTQSLVLSPVVIAMWKPMAQALGWGTKPIGWGDILALTQNPKGWSAYGHPEWGKFKFGHTHPQYSNSGLMTAFAITYAGAGKVNGLTSDDVQNPAVGQFMGQIESSVEHYGTSTGFFADKLVENGPSYLSAAVLYENLVVTSYAHKDSMTFPLVAVYPKEGTFWSDHPIGIVQRDWVTAEKKDAAKVFIDYLLADAQQTKALTYGFRPASPKVAIASPISADFGVDPSEPKTTLEMPKLSVMDGIIKLWHQQKKKANVVLVLDTSGSMNQEQKLINAKAGAKELLDLMDDSDTFSLIRFSSDMTWAPGQGQPLGQNRQAVKDYLDSLIADGETRLFDSIDVAVKSLEAMNDDKKIDAVVVLTDGEDNKSSMNEQMLIDRLSPRGEKQGMRVFTIAYGHDAATPVLQHIAAATRAKFYLGTPENIREVFKEIATFF